MVPIFPFMQASKGESEFLIRTSDKIGIDQHLLSSGYARMSSLSSWSDFASPSVLDVSNQGALESELTFSFLRWALALFAPEMSSRAMLAMDRARQR